MTCVPLFSILYSALRVRYITDSRLVASSVSLCTAIIGVWHTEALGRRKMLILGSFLCAVTLGASMLSSALSHTNISAMTHGNAAASRAAIACLMIFCAAYAWVYQPLLPIYPSEVLGLEQRSAGMGLFVLVLNLCCESFWTERISGQCLTAAFLNQLVIPIALQKIGWWTYLPFVIWDLVETGAWYLFAVETKGRTRQHLRLAVCSAE